MRSFLKKSMCVHPQPCTGNAVLAIFISTEAAIPAGPHSLVTGTP